MQTVLAGLVWLAAWAQDGRPGADELVAQGWKFLPPYSGEHREFLTAQERTDTAVAAHLFAAAVELQPEHLRALWSLGHAQVLLAEDRKNRGDPAARVHDAEAIDALSRALALDPEDPWTAYARGALHASFGRHVEALDDLARAVANAERGMKRSGEEGQNAWLRFKALEWRGEVLMRHGRFDEALAALSAFHREFSTSAWPLHVALAECHLRRRDLAGAREQYQVILELFPSDHQAYAALGYLAGLLGDRAEATRRLAEAIRYEREPGLYTRLWWWILATDEARPAAEEELRAFLEHPPGGVSEWDRGLGRFVLGAASVEVFLEAARAEEERRKTAGLPLDHLPCEARFYAGLRLEDDARRAAGAERRGELLESARRAYGEALGFAPESWKWEWAFARQRYAALCERLGSGLAPGFAVEGGTLRLEGEDFELLEGAWHAPGEERPSAELDRPRRAGDLFLARVRGADGRECALRLVVLDAALR